MNIALILAAGMGRRMGTKTPKQFLEVGGKPILAHTLDVFQKHPEIDEIFLVTDYESSFVSMTQALEGKKTYQLYRDYLDNFRINAGRNSR